MDFIIRRLTTYPCAIGGILCIYIGTAPPCAIRISLGFGISKELPHIHSFETRCVYPYWARTMQRAKRMRTKSAHEVFSNVSMLAWLISPSMKVALLGSAV